MMGEEEEMEEGGKEGRRWCCESREGYCKRQEVREL